MHFWDTLPGQRLASILSTYLPVLAEALDSKQTVIKVSTSDAYATIKDALAAGKTLAQTVTDGDEVILVFKERRDKTMDKEVISFWIDSLIKKENAESLDKVSVEALKAEREEALGAADNEHTFGLGSAGEEAKQHFDNEATQLEYAKLLEGIIKRRK